MKVTLCFAHLTRALCRGLHLNLRPVRFPLNMRGRGYLDGGCWTGVAGTGAINAGATGMITVTRRTWFEEGYSLEIGILRRVDPLSREALQEVLDRAGLQQQLGRVRRPRLHGTRTRGHQRAWHRQKESYATMRNVIEIIHRRDHQHI